jgi:hypothetical protein
MDKKQLATIAITALVSVTLKELLSWIFVSAKTIAVKDTVKEKARTIFNKNNRRIVWTALILSASAYAFFDTMRSTKPLTRWGVLDIIAITLGLLFWVFKLFWDVGMVAKPHIYKWRQKRSSSPTQL